MIITEMPTAHVPVEIFRFQVESEHIRENGVHGAGNVFGGRTCEIGRCCQWSIASLPKLCRFCRTISAHIIFLRVSLILFFPNSYKPRSLNPGCASGRRPSGQ